MLRGKLASESSSFLLEVKRNDIINRSRRESPGRYLRRRGYFISRVFPIDTSLLAYEDVLEISVLVKDYIVTISFPGVLSGVKEVYSSLRKRPNFPSIYSVLKRVLDSADVKVDCSCPDFVYRFAYWATRGGFKAGAPETRKPTIRNVFNDQGCGCKHVLYVISNVTNEFWLRRAVPFVRKLVIKNPELIGLTREEVGAVTKREEF